MIGDEPRRALFIAYVHTQYVELARVAKLVEGAGSYSPRFLFGHEFDYVERDVATCVSDGFPAFDPAGRTLGGADDVRRDEWPGLHPGWSRRTGEMVGRMWNHLVPESPLSIPFWLWHSAGLQRLARRMIRQQSISLLVIAEDNVAYSTAEWIRAGHLEGVRTVIVPFTVTSASEPAEYIYNWSAHQLSSGANRLAARLYPRWVYRHKGRELMRLPAGRLLAREWQGLAPAQPWASNTGAADTLAVESEFMLRHYLREGARPESLVVTGALTDDLLAEGMQEAQSRRRELCAQLGLRPDHVLVLVAVPPSQFGYTEHASDFDDYRQAMEYWMRTLAALPGCEVIARLHPRLVHDDMSFTEECGVRIVDAETAWLIPVCDLYVANSSATIRSAIACGKPVVNYDFHRLRYGDFDEAPGVVTVETRAEFESTLLRFATDAHYRTELAARQRSAAGDWGILDGKAADRLLRLLDAGSGKGGAAPEHALATGDGPGTIFQRDLQ